MGDPVGDQVLQTLGTQVLQRLLCCPCVPTNFLAFLILCQFFFVFVVALGGPELLLGSLTGPQGLLEVSVGFLGRSSEVSGGFWVIP